MKNIIIDTETTGISAKDEIIELAYMAIYANEFDWHAENMGDYIDNLLNRVVSQRYMPNVPIHAGAQKVHGLTKNVLKGSPNAKEAVLPTMVETIFGHNVAFDHRMLKAPTVGQVCSLKLVRFLDKQKSFGLPNHRLDTCMEVFYPELQLLNRGFHSAKLDVVKTYLLFHRLHKEIPAIKTLKALMDFCKLIEA